MVERTPGWAERSGEAPMSDKSIAAKLLIKPDTTVWASDPARLGLIGPLPAGVRTVDRLAGATTVVVFADDARTLRAVLAEHGRELADPSFVWVAYPKANRTDINRDSIWPLLVEHGLRPITQVSLDEVWSALRFRPLRADEVPLGREA